MKKSPWAEIPTPPEEEGIQGIAFGTRKRIPGSSCVECGYFMDGVSGDAGPGDLSLCIRCGSLNVFNDEMKNRVPTVAEVLEAAASPHVQRLRRIILSVPKGARW